MLSSSILGKLYIYWRCSLLYAVLSRIAHVFDNAWNYSLARRIVFHESRLQKWYEDCLISKVIDSVIAFVLRILSAVCGYLEPACRNSFFVRMFSGSVFCNFDLLIGAYICVMFMVPHSFWSNAIALLAAVGLMAIFFVRCAMKKAKLLDPKKLSLPFLLFVAITFIAPIYSTEISDSRRILLFFITAFIFMWLTASYTDSPDKLKNLMMWIYIAVIFTALYAIGQRLAGIEANPTFIDSELNPNIPARVYSTVDNPNNYAELIVLFTPMAAVYAMNEKKMWKRLILCCLLALPAAALLMTYSRSGWLSIALAVCVFVYYTDRRLVPWIFVAGILCVPFLPASIITRLGNMFNTADASANFRIQLWSSCLKLLSMDNRWLTGIGLGPKTYNHNLLLVTTQRIAEGMPHTQMLYMELVMGWGIMGFISYMWFIIGRIKDGCIAIFRAKDEYVHGALIACVSSFVGIAILCVFEYIWFYPRILFAYFILLGIMIACVEMSRK